MSDNGPPLGALPLNLPDIPDDQIDTLAKDIEKSGFAVLPSYVGSDLLAHLRDLVGGLVAASGGEYTVRTGREEMTNTLLDAIGRTPSFVQLMRGLYEKTCGKPAPEQDLYQVLRCLMGKTGAQHAYFFHYDSYVVTALLPIVTPTEGNTGDLLMRPNFRSVRSTYMANLLDKLLVDNKWAQVFFRRRAIARKSFVKVKIIPGNLYLFWGYRSVHANEACDIDKVRATALFHFGDPHADSTLREFIRKQRR
jgi:hypothetical protein